MNITTTPLETEYGPKLDLAFKYDPTIIAAVKTIEGRWYHGDRKTWSIPAARLDELRKLLPDVTIDGEVQYGEAVSNVAPLVANADLARLLREAADRSDTPPF